MCQTCIDDGSISAFLHDVIQAFLMDQGQDLQFGNGHIVLADDNVETHHIEWCLEQMSTERENDAAAIPFLRWMLTIPESERVPGGVSE